MRRGGARGGAFSLVELLVSMSLLMVLVAIFTGIFSLINGVSHASQERLAALETARGALSAITHRLSAATLAPRREVLPAQGWGKVPLRPDQILPGQAVTDWYSRLHFVCGPAASILGDSVGPRLTHAVFFVDGRGDDRGEMVPAGFGVEFSAPDDVPAFAASAAPLLRLVEYGFPEEALDVLRESQSDVWLTRFLGPAADDPARARELALGVVALLFQPPPPPDDPTRQPDYLFDSRAWHRRPNRIGSNPMRDRLPPTLGVTLVVLEPAAAARVAAAGPEQARALTADLFTEAGSYDADMHALADRLEPWGGHRVFRSTVVLDQALPVP